MYYRNASAAVIVVDITDAQSLKVANRWIMDIHQRAVNADCYIILALNKVDLEERALTPEAVQSFCAEKGIDYIETSAKSGYNVSELFDKICDACLVLETSEASGVISCSATAPPSKVGLLCCREETEMLLRLFVTNSGIGTIDCLIFMGIDHPALVRGVVALHH